MAIGAGAVLQKAENLPQVDRDPLTTLSSVTSSNDRQQVTTAFKAPQEATPPAVKQDEGKGRFKYESRVMQGIWAAAPYLHNGSVPTLADLLKPADQRPKSFTISADYDIDKIGLASTPAADGLHWTYQTTGCEQRNSGRSRCGHEYGVSLSDDDKRALLEYLKTL